MSKASIWGINPNGYGTCIQEYANSFLYMPSILRMFAEKYHVQGTLLDIVRQVNDAVQANTQDETAWSFFASDIFLAKDKEKVADILEGMAWLVDSSSAIVSLAADLRSLPEDYAFFVFQGTDVTPVVEEWFRKEEKDISLFDHKEPVADFAILSNDGIRYVPSNCFRRKKEKPPKKEKKDRAGKQKKELKDVRNIFFSSDFHFNHDKEFVWKDRGYSCVQEMNEDILKKCRERITEKDDFYILGDVCFGKDKEANRRLVEQIPGKVHIIRGNHDSDEKMAMYASCSNVVEVCEGKYLHEGNMHFFLSHTPSVGSSLSYLSKPKALTKCIFSLHGHTHQEENVFFGIPCMYHVGVDSHNMYPVSLEEVMADIRKNVWEFQKHPEKFYEQLFVLLKQQMENGSVKIEL